MDLSSPAPMVSLGKMGKDSGKNRMNTVRLIVALILVGILIIGFEAALFVNGFGHDGRTAHISVHVDKHSYDAGENVTFKLIDKTPGVEFNVTEPNGSPLYHFNCQGEIDIIKIPDDIDPDMAMADLSNENLFFRRIGTDIPVATVNYGYFNDRESPKNMSWNGITSVPNTLNADVSITMATSGYYVILPKFSGASDRKIQFDLDREAIFYYSSMEAKINITNNPDNNVTVRLQLGMPPGMIGDQVCELFSDFRYAEFPAHDFINMTNPKVDNYHNETLVLTPGNNTLRTIVFEVKIPDYGEGAGDGVVFQTVFFEALLVTPVGNCTFGFNGIWNGGWQHVQQY